MITGMISWIIKMIKQGDIIIVKYPFSDNPKRSKKRPAIVISNEKSNSLDNDLLVSPITSTIRNSPFSYVIKKGDTTNPLPKKSEIRCNKIITIRKTLVLGKFTTIIPSCLPKIIKLVKSSF